MSTNRPELKAQVQELTEKERMFVERYLTHWNGKRAAMETGYKEELSRTAAHEMLHKPYIRNYIDGRVREIVMEADEALARLAAIARGDMGDFISFDTNGVAYVDIEKAKELGITHLIKTFSVSRFGTVSIELYSAMEALEKMMKYLNLYKDTTTNVNVTVNAWADFVTKAKDEEVKQLNG